MDDTLVKFLLAIFFVAIIVVILFYAITDKVLSNGTTKPNTNTQNPHNENINNDARTSRLYTYIFSIILPLIGIMLYLKEELVQAGIAMWWYVAIFLGMMLAGFVITILYNYLPAGSISLLFANFLIFLLLLLIVFVGLAIVYNMVSDYFSKQTGKTAFYIQLLFYIPCLITDFIKYVFKEFRSTPNMVFVLFIAEILLVLVYVYGPDVSNMMVTQNSILLLPDYRPLNAFNTIAQGSSFQVKDPMDAIRQLEERDMPDCVDINSINLDDPSLDDKDHSDTQNDNPRKPTLTGITDPLYVSTGLTDPSNNMCKFNPYMRVDPYIAVKCSKINLDDIRDPKIYNSQSMYDTVAARIKREYNDKLKEQQNAIFNVNYAISFWTFLNYKPEVYRSPHEVNVLNYSNPANDYKGFGGNPKITFLNDEYNVYFSNHPKCESKNKYESGCMYKIRLQNQRWNNFVLNYYSDHVDLFINGILEKTYKFSDNAPIYSINDQINIGELNGAYGSICNVVYYRTPLTKPEITSYYNLLSIRNPPILKL